MKPGRQAKQVTINNPLKGGVPRVLGSMAAKRIQGPGSCCHSKEEGCQKPTHSPSPSPWGWTVGTYVGGLKLAPRTSSA